MSGGPREAAGSRAPDWQEKAWVLGSFKSSIRLCPCANCCGTHGGSKFRFLLDGGQVSALSQLYAQGQALGHVAQYRSGGWRLQGAPTGQKICQDWGGLDL